MTAAAAAPAPNSVPTGKALLAAPQMVKAPPAAMLVRVARAYGVSPIRQMREAFLLSRGKSRLFLNEYFSSGLYHPDLSWQAKKQYVGSRSSWDLNAWLSPSSLNGQKTFVADKVMYTSLLEQLGFRTTKTQAVFSTLRRAGNIPTLSTAKDLRKFLTEDAVFPLFGKPQSYSGSFGSALLDHMNGSEIVLGDGRGIDLDDFCAEIVREYGEGYLFQSALEQHETLSKVAGNAIGTLRIVTIRDEQMPRPMYALWKVPSPKAMSDNFWQDGSMIAPVDEQTGIVGQCRIGTGPDARDIEEHPVSGEKFKGLQIPHWDEACKMAAEAHALFPEFGVIGWDVAMTPDGPSLIECNDNPFHSLYQLAFQRGIKNDDFMPVFEAAAKRSRDMLDYRNNLVKKRQKQQKTGKPA
ncbi:hypothetical protein K3727_05025 [Rhodobacteraceae bacterium M382]|nr:hypothetical protein K3727_05025 [Rhodobacteraceae bacterium M382]